MNPTKRPLPAAQPWKMSEDDFSAIAIALESIADSMRLQAQCSRYLARKAGAVPDDLAISEHELFGIQPIELPTIKQFMDLVPPSFNKDTSEACFAIALAQILALNPDLSDSEETAP